MFVIVTQVSKERNQLIQEKRNEVVYKNSKDEAEWNGISGHLTPKINAPASNDEVDTPALTAFQGRFSAQTLIYSGRQYFATSMSLVSAQMVFRIDY